MSQENITFERFCELQALKLEQWKANYLEKIRTASKEESLNWPISMEPFEWEESLLAWDI